ncbi:MAG: 2OG-Fe(II) oxygenase [Gammaproteobacteria bacterium]
MNNVIATTTQVLLASLTDSVRDDSPYPHWLLQRCLPEEVVDAVAGLPIPPAHIDDTQGRRETHNDSRIHFGLQYRRGHAMMDTLARVFQSAAVTDALRATTGASLSGTSLRIEYCQDTDGFWLEPHTDIGVKKFTMLIYLNREPQGSDWGTDIYADRDTHMGRAPAGANRGLIFVPSDQTWHGFEKRPMNGVRKSLIINYVGPEWRNRHELCFPEDVIG